MRFSTADIATKTAAKFELAISEYQDFIKYYPDNPNAARAQLNIGQIHYTQQKFELAASDFDVIIAKYPDDTTVTPQAYFLKGMSLKGTKPAEAVKAWREIIKRYPHTDSEAQAKEQLRAMGVSLTTAATPARRKPH